jgi:hypothetical protein
MGFHASSGIGFYPCLRALAHRFAIGQAFGSDKRFRSCQPIVTATVIRVGAIVMQIPAHRGQSFQRIADSVPVIADSCR